MKITIVIEGSRGSGKTTVMRRIMSLIEAEFGKDSVYPGEQTAEGELERCKFMLHFIIGPKEKPHVRQ